MGFGEDAAAFWRSPASWCLAAVFAAAVAALAAAPSRGRTLFAVFLALHAALFGALYAKTPFGAMEGATRYFIPLVPGFAAFSAAGAAAAAEALFRRRRAAGFAAAAVFALCGAVFAGTELRLCRARERAEAALGNRAAEVRRALDGESAFREPCFARWDFNYLNWMPGRRLVATNPVNGRNPRLVRELEESDSPGFLDDYGGAAGFVAATGGSARRIRAGKRRLLVDAVPPPPAAEIPPGAAVSASAGSGGDIRDVLFDDNLATFAAASARPGGSVVYDVELDPAAPSVCGVRAVPAPGGAARRWRAESLDGPEPELLAESGVADLFWSGPRVFQGGVDLRWELRWKPRPLRRVRLVFSDLGPRRSPRVADLRFLTPAAAAPEPVDAGDVAGAVDAARRGEPGLRVFADRWLSGKLGVPRAPSAETELSGPAAAGAWKDETTRIDFSRLCLAVCDPGTAARSEAFLRERGIPFERGEAGGAVLLRFGGSPEGELPGCVRFVAGALVRDEPEPPPEDLFRPAEADFPGTGARLRGFSFPSGTPEPGKTARIDLFWEFPVRGARSRRLRCFADFVRDGKTLFSASSPLPEWDPRTGAPDLPETVPVSLVFPVPADAPSGPYGVSVSLSRSDSPRRLVEPAAGPHRTEDRKVVLPGAAP